MQLHSPWCLTVCIQGKWRSSGFRQVFKNLILTYSFRSCSWDSEILRTHYPDLHVFSWGCILVWITREGLDIYLFESIIEVSTHAYLFSTFVPLSEMQKVSTFAVLHFCILMFASDYIRHPDIWELLLLLQLGACSNKNAGLWDISYEHSAVS